MNGTQVKPTLKYRSVGSYYTATHFPDEILREALSYEHQPEDVFIVTYPKCGTSWMQGILYQIYTNGAPVESIEDFVTRMPFLERMGVEGLADLPRPGSAIKTHMLYDEDRVSKRAKYIYVARNPYDCCVSFYNHYKLFPLYQFEDGTFEQFFEQFMRGEVEFGDYFDHLLSWYPHRDEPNVLFMTYEDLKQDTRFWVQKLADFLGSRYGDNLRQDPDAMERILDATSVANVRELFRRERDHQRQVTTKTPIDEMPRWAVLFQEAAGDLLKKPHAGEFVRKGMVGDWKNYFKPEQIERMKRKARERCNGINVMELWKHLGIC
ncbi:hypothetical protein HPB47_004800 [Ixodes persulcatus]|uniref:Uncharacterized protein n=1 Tax=Ixodes persulcatus TaxID=34615 RepID=A0AC60PFK6_IXOPE|nr:hypothetical protein HPB47_004800 [Ixodes persulcatus]